MATQVMLPRLGQGMETGTIVRWLKEVGDTVERGEPLYEVDTEKVTQEVEAETAGVLLVILAEPGDEVPVGAPICVMGDAGEEVPPELAARATPTSAEASPAEAAGDQAAPAGAAAEPATEAAAVEAPAPAVPAPAPAAAGPSPVPVTAEATRGDGRVKASPLARRMARERGIDLAQIQGTGPEGRVVAGDVERAAAAPAAWATPVTLPTEVEVVRLSSMRRTIARRLTEAWEAPAFQLGASADMTAVLRLRERLAERTPEGGVKPTVTDVLVKAAALALMRHRAVNAHFAGDEIHLYPTANVGLAVAVPDGLVVPVIANAERLSIPEIATARADLVARARGGKLVSADLEGGTFSISNLGMFGIERFVAVLNPPQAAILAVGAVREMPVAVAGELVVQPRVELVLTCDHRAVDGATGAEFLRTLRDFLEEPGLAL
jgi:pyruvate dehydrogenase E2 component (dihydrolipoamide acetyltransferase)